MKKGKLLGSALAAVIAIGGSFTYYHEVLADSSQKAESNKTVESTNEGGKTISLDPKIEYHNGVSKDVKFQVKEPSANLLPDGLKKLNKRTETIQQNGHQLNVVTQAWVDKDAKNKPKYKQKQLLIIQSNDDGSNKPKNILAKGQKVKVAGVDGWVINPKLEDPTQIMFWKNGHYYNVRGQNIKVDKLIRIAESLFK